MSQKQNEDSTIKAGAGIAGNMGFVGSQTRVIFLLKI
jgi:hypothetical protein